MPEETRSTQVGAAGACFILGALLTAAGLCTGRGLLDLLGITASAPIRGTGRSSLFVAAITIVLLGAGVALLVAGVRSLQNAAKRRKARGGIDEDLLPKVKIKDD